MYYAARRVGLDNHDTEDFVQECRVKILSGELDAKLKDLLPRELVGKIVGFARNFRTKLGRRKLRVSYDTEKIQEVVDTRIVESESLEAKDLLERLLENLKPRYRLAIRLWLKYLSHAKVAEEMGLSLNAAKVLLSRARSALRKANQNEMPQARNPTR
jgi:RNA polymerase sigma factor (sigma-70 family)